MSSKVNRSRSTKIAVFVACLAALVGALAALLAGSSPTVYVALFCAAGVLLLVVVGVLVARGRSVR